MGCWGETRRSRRQRLGFGTGPGSVGPALRRVVHVHLLVCLRPAPASLARVMANGLTRDALRPRSDAGRGRRSEGERRRSSPRVLFAGNRTQGGTAVMGAAVTRIARHGASGKTQLARCGESPPWGKLRDVKRPACLGYADRRNVEAAARLRVSHAAEHEEPVKVRGALRSTY